MMFTGGVRRTPPAVIQLLLFYNGNQHIASIDFSGVRSQHIQIAVRIADDNRRNGVIACCLYGIHTDPSSIPSGILLRVNLYPFSIMVSITLWVFLFG